jgi:hypothetical protein
VDRARGSPAEVVELAVPIGTRSYRFVRHPRTGAPTHDTHGALVSSPSVTRTSPGDCVRGIREPGRRPTASSDVALRSPRAREPVAAVPLSAPPTGRTRRLSWPTAGLRLRAGVEGSSANQRRANPATPALAHTVAQMTSCPRCSLALRLAAERRVHCALRVEHGPAIGDAHMCRSRHILDIGRVTGFTLPHQQHGCAYS